MGIDGGVSDSIYRCSNRIYGKQGVFWKSVEMVAGYCFSNACSDGRCILYLFIIQPVSAIESRYWIKNMFFCNILFLCVANFIFLITTRLDNERIKYLVCISAFLYVNIWYALSSMSECLRYSLSIVLCGLFIRLLKCECSKFFSYAILPLIIIMAGFVYLMFVLVIPIYIYCNAWGK